MGPMPISLRAMALPLMAALLAACATPSPSPSAGIDGTPSVAPTPGATASRTADPRPTATEPPIAGDPPPLALEEVAAGLDAPIGIAATPDGLLLVNERVGRVMAVDLETGETSGFLDLFDRVLGGDERGLLGLALHPDWPEDARAFVHYSDLAGDTVLSEFGVSDLPTPSRLDPATERVLLQVAQPYTNHNGGQLAFGPDGFLYIGLGDGGSGGDPQRNGQNREALLGKVLRIDVDADAEPYGIPSDNPFADGADGAPEVFLIGLRNPWRFSFDSETGVLWIADVGQNAYEEIDRVDPVADAGANLGWNVMEASHCFAQADCDADGLMAPVAEYGRDLGCSVTGGYVYRGEAIPDLRGWYLFSDYCSGTLFGIPSDADGIVGPRVLLETGANVSTFGEDADGELYLADIESGTIYRVVSGG
jgi:glucose/arabinose dehydrogenase